MNWPAETLSYVGCPGSGKSQVLTDICVSALRRGLVDPSELVAVSYTRAARSELKGRICTELDLKPSELPYVNTLHSMAARLIGVTKGQYVTTADHRAVMDELKLRFTDTTGDGLRELLEGDDRGIRPEAGDILVAWNEFRRNGRHPFDVSLRLFSRMLDMDVPERLARSYMDAYDDLLRRRYDFTSIIETALADQLCPPCRVVMADEAQDLTNLQHAYLQVMANRAGRLILSFDEDQCIYQWQGCTTDWLLAMPGKRRFLDQTYRCGPKVHALADQLIRRNKQRHDKTWRAAGHEDAIETGDALDSLESQLAHDDTSSIAVLARNRCFLTRVARHLLERVIPFDNLSGPNPFMHVPYGVGLALAMAEGKPIRLSQFVKLIDQIPQKGFLRRGVRTDLHTGLDSGALEDVEITRADLERLGCLPTFVDSLMDVGTALTALRVDDLSKRVYTDIYRKHGISWLLSPTARVTLGTIHATKGREFDCVVLMKDQTRRTAESQQADPEGERRVWYVGITRTRHRLTLCPTTGKYGYDEV